MKRRSILNIDSLAEELATAGWPVRIYEPGTANLVEQASTFHHCAGVIGIRGAELANIVWMRPGAKVLMLANPVGIENYGAFNLANTLKVGFDQLMVSNRFPSVSASEIIQRLSV
jgi:capsular polysaccharide biosynthesis protein